MNVYKRTAAGNAAALDPKSPLPRKLRTLLISVDGRTRKQTYINTLSSFGDVAALLESLLQQGYVEIERTESDEPATRPGRTDWQPTNTQVTERLDQGAMAPAALESAFEKAGIRNSDVPSDDLSSWDRFQPEPSFQRASAPSGSPSSFSARSEPAARPGAPPSSAQYQLRSAISLMSDFVTTHLPGDSLEIVLTLEGLSSVEQVIASLKGYQAMIAPAGPAAAHHLDELRALLSRR